MAEVEIEDLGARLAEAQEFGISVKFKSFNITSSQLKAIHTTPQLLVPQPGIGKYIQVVFETGIYIAGSTGYAGFSQPAIYPGGDTGATDWNTSDGMPDFSSTDSAIWSKPRSLNGNDPVSMVENQSLIFTDTTDWTTGDGRLILNLAWLVAPCS